MFSLWHLRSIAIENKLSHLATKTEKRRLVGAGIERLKIALRTIYGFLPIGFE